MLKWRQEAARKPAKPGSLLREGAGAVADADAVKPWLTGAHAAGGQEWRGHQSAKAKGRGCQAGLKPPLLRGLWLESQRLLLATAQAGWSWGSCKVGRGWGNPTSTQALQQPAGMARARHVGPRLHATWKHLAGLSVACPGPRALGEVASAADAGHSCEPSSCRSLFCPPWPIFPRCGVKGWFGWCAPECWLCPATVGDGCTSPALQCPRRGSDAGRQQDQLTSCLGCSGCKCPMCQKHPAARSSRRRFPRQRQLEATAWPVLPRPPGGFAQVSSWGGSGTVVFEEGGTASREADALPPRCAVLHEGRERREVCLVGQPLNQCILISKRSNSSKWQQLCLYHLLPWGLLGV